jgi:peptide/nickel transport system substrate-binding protein
MMARHVWEKAGDVKTFTHFPPVSLGAYKYADSDPNGYWELFQRRDDWQKTSAGMLTGQPGPEYILTIFYGDDQHKIIAMTRHGLDVLMDLNFEAFASLRKSTSSARSWYKDFPWAYPNELNARFFGLNVGKPPLDNKDVRWALALALDIVGLQTAYVGGVTRVTPFLVPAVPSLMKLYHLPLEAWLKELTIEIGSGETFKPYDAGVPARIGQWARKNGHSVGDDPDELRKLFGIGWWKHSPETATRLLTKAGLRKSEGKWMLPNGQPWKISIIAAPDESDAFRLANGAQDQWKKFGIDVDVVALERSPFTTRQQTGDFDVASTWGAIAPYPIPDLWQGLNAWTSRFYAPIGQSTAASGSNNFVRFRSPEFDEAVAALGKLPPDDGQVVEMGQRAMKIWAENMLTLNTVSFKKFITTDDTYWTGWPSSEHPERQPLYWFMGGRFTVQQISPARSKK